MPFCIQTFNRVTNFIAFQMLKLKVALVIVIEALLLKYWMVLVLYQEWTI
jgi:hypothetical protein